MKHLAAFAAGMMLATPAAAQDSASSPAFEASDSSSKLEMANAIIDTAYPQDARVAMFQKISEQMEGQMLQSLQGIITDDGALAILTEWQKEMSVETNVILERNIPSLMSAWAQAYADIYTEQELRDILDFVSTPSGKTFLIKTNDVIAHPEFAAANQSYIDEIVALIPAEIPDLVARLEAYKAAQEQNPE
ncbi:MAG: DUF2059 domain-containing protein [Pseudomonadota bacterium]